MATSSALIAQLEIDYADGTVDRRHRARVDGPRPARSLLRHLRRRGLRRPAARPRLVDGVVRRERWAPGGDAIRPEMCSSPPTGRRSARRDAARFLGQHEPQWPDHRRLRAEPGRTAAYPGDRRGRRRRHPPSRRGARGRRARDGPLRAAKATDTYTLARRRLGRMGTPIHLPRLPLRRGHRLARRVRSDRRCCVAEVLHSDMRRTGWFTASDARRQAARERGVGHARQLRGCTHRLPAAR